MLVIRELLWRPQFVEKIWSKHSVTMEEIRQILRRKFSVRRAERGKVRGEDLYTAFGQTEAGRYLVVGFILKIDRRALIITARDMTGNERRTYARS